MKKNKLNITRRQFMAGTAAAVGAAAVSGCRSEAKQYSKKHGKRPNLLFLFSDQQSFDMLGCYGNKQIITPNIDKAASEGVRFNHCISNTPVCSPYRAMLMSGQHPLYNGVITNDIQVMINNGKFFGEALRDSGYRMGYVGKWHIHGGERERPIPAGPNRLGFDNRFLSNNCTLEFNPPHCYYWDERGKKQHYDVWEPYGEAQHAVNFLDECTDDNPFALFVSWHPPHDMGWRNEKFHYPTLPELMKMYERDKIKLRPGVEDTPEVREFYHGHMAMCTGIDKAFGTVLDKLKEKGLDRNTIVVFTSDHGDLLKSHGRPWPKGTPEDESCRVPLVVRWPEELPAGRTSELLVGALDLMPTLLGMMDCEIPDTCQGLDLSEHIFAGRDNAVKSVPLFYFRPDWRGVYTHRYTYAIEKKLSLPQGTFNVLYDRKKDPRQLNNVFGKPEYKSVQQKLDKLTWKWMKKFGDNFVDGQTILGLCGFRTTGTLSGPGDKTIPLARPIDLLKAAKL